MNSNSPLDDQWYPRLSERVHIETIPGTEENPKGPLFFVLDPDVPSWAILNEDGVELLRACNGTHSVSDVADIVARRKGTAQGNGLCAGPAAG